MRNAGWWTQKFQLSGPIMFTPYAVILKALLIFLFVVNATLNYTQITLAFVSYLRTLMVSVQSIAPASQKCIGWIPARDL